MTRSDLPRRQGELLEYLRGYIKEHGCAPSIREVRVFMGLASTNGAREHLLALERKGYIQRHKGRPRGVTLTDKAGPSLTVSRQAVADWLLRVGDEADRELLDRLRQDVLSGKAP